MFREASQNRIFQDIVSQIQEVILTGRIKPGDTLPPERELKEMFNTSRGTLREALRVLEERGLLEMRLGVRGGATVMRIPERHATDSLARLIQARQISLTHLSEFREAMEGNVAALAAQRATEGDIETLNSLLEEAERHAAGGNSGRGAFIEVDQRFHMAIADITRNPVFILVFHSIHENINRYYDRFLAARRFRMQENFRDLEDITRAIESRNSEKVKILAQSHIMRFHRQMKEKKTGS